MCVYLNLVYMNTQQHALKLKWDRRKFYSHLALTCQVFEYFAKSDHGHSIVRYYRS